MDVPGFASVLTTGGGLVFNGDPTGILRAFDADTGKVLWSFNTGSGMRSGIISYAVDWRAVHFGAKRVGLLRCNLASGVVPPTREDACGFDPHRL